MSLAALAAEGRLGPAHVHHATIGSTNAAAFERIERAEDSAAVLPLTGPAWWTTADRQTGGRGRRGREWVSPPGNLYATAVFALADGAGRATLPLLAANALADAIEASCPAAATRVALKWPNDVLLDDRKVAGILLEVRRFRSGDYVAVGFGVNCASHPPAVAATSFADAGLALEPATLLPALAAAFDRERAADAAGARAVERWRARAKGMGRLIVVRLPNEERRGTFENMAADGRLVLRQENGERTLIAVGDVFFPSEKDEPMIEPRLERASHA